MKKKILGLIFAAGVMGFALTGCSNYQILDTTYSYNYAYISLPNGECIEGVVDSWRDYEDGNQIQVTIAGKTYLTDTTRAVLVSGTK